MAVYKIYPVAEQGSVKFSSYYTNASGQVSWLDRDGKTIKRGAPPKDVRPFGQMVSRGAPLSLNYNKGVVEDERVLLYFKDHPNVVCNGYENKNLTNPQFILEVESEIINQDHKILQQHGVIWNQINSMSLQDLRNTAFLFNEFDPSKMDEEELKVKLVGVRFDGPAVTKTHVTPGGERVLIFNDFRTRDAEEKEMLIIIMKAINWNILKMENGQFVVGTTAVGSTPEEVLLTCRANSDLYKSHIRAKVVRADENIQSTAAKEATKPLTAVSFSEIKKPEPRPNIAVQAGKGIVPEPEGIAEGKFFKGYKPELTEAEIAEGWYVESAGFGNYKTFLAKKEQV